MNSQMKEFPISLFILGEIAKSVLVQLHLSVCVSSFNSKLSVSYHKRLSVEVRASQVRAKSRALSLPLSLCNFWLAY